MYLDHEDGFGKFLKGFSKYKYIFFTLVIKKKKKKKKGRR